jgi:hypothetical protein
MVIGNSVDFPPFSYSMDGCFLLGKSGFNFHEIVIL